MLGPIGDVFFRLFENRKGEIPSQMLVKRKCDSNSEKAWIMFLPEFVFKSNYLNSRLNSVEGDIFMYGLHKTAVQSNPVKTRDLLRKIVDCAEKDVKSYNGKYKELNVLGISMGNVLSFNFATKFPINNCVSAVPGSYLPECIVESISTRKIAESCPGGLEAYQKSLKEFNPAMCLNNTKAKKFDITLARWDKMIPYKRGKELADAVISKGLNVKLKTYPLAGHVEGIFYFANDFSRSF